MTIKIENFKIKIDSDLYSVGADNRPFGAIISDVQLLCTMAEEEGITVEVAMASAGYERVLPERSLWSHSGGTGYQRSWVAQPGWGFCRRGE